MLDQNFSVDDSIHPVLILSFHCSVLSKNSF